MKNVRLPPDKQAFSFEAKNEDKITSRELKQPFSTSVVVPYSFFRSFFKMIEEEEKTKGKGDANQPRRNE